MSFGHWQLGPPLLLILDSISLSTLSAYYLPTGPLCYLFILLTLWILGMFVPCYPGKWEGLKDVIELSEVYLCGALFWRTISHLEGLLKHVALPLEFLTCEVCDRAQFRFQWKVIVLKE